MFFSARVYNVFFSLCPRLSRSPAHTASITPFLRTRAFLTNATNNYYEHLFRRLYIPRWCYMHESLVVCVCVLDSLYSARNDAFLIAHITYCFWRSVRVPYSIYSAGNHCLRSGTFFFFFFFHPQSVSKKRGSFSRSCLPHHRASTSGKYNTRSTGSSIQVELVEQFVIKL